MFLMVLTSNSTDTAPNKQQTKSYQVVVWPDAKQFSEVAEGHRSVRFEAEVREMVRWSEVAPFTRVQSIRGQESNFI